MEEEIFSPWWRTPLKVLAAVLGLLALSGLMMGLILLVAHLIEAFDTPSPPAHIEPPPVERNARTYVPGPYDPQWPDSPARRPALGRLGGGGSAVQAGPGASPAPAQAAVPVGISVEDFREAAAAGKKLYLPNPQGECNLSGAQSSSALEACFAERVAR
ncbi:MAG: hypothetical protein N3C63_08070 [Rhodocyclaceae bacterium]|nr:hypothetical protein [Rhodocyclaceae bacterium]